MDFAGRKRRLKRNAALGTVRRTSSLESPPCQNLVWQGLPAYTRCDRRHGCCDVCQKDLMTNIMSNQGTGRCCAAALPVSHSAVRATSPGYRALARCFSSAGGVEAADDVVLMTEAAVKVRLSLSWKVRRCASDQAHQEDCKLRQACDPQRLHELVGTSASPGETCLRLTVEAGGCSGFSYQCADLVRCLCARLTTVQVLPCLRA